MNVWLALLLCYVYIFAALGLAETLRRRLGYGSDFTRKVIHISVGMMSWGLPFLFETPWPFIGAAISFMVLNFLDWRFGFFAAMASTDRSNLGTVYFPFVAAAAVYLFWEQPPLMVAALMPLTWGDGMAPIVGRAFGKHGYTVLGHRRTVEGSVGFLGAGFLFTWLALWLMAGPPIITPIAALLPAVTVMLLTTLIEAISIWGLDNLTVTGLAILVLSLWPF